MDADGRTNLRRRAAGLDDHTSGAPPARERDAPGTPAVMDTDEILDVEAVVAEARIAEARIATETREKAAVTAIEMPEAAGQSPRC